MHKNECDRKNKTSSDWSTVNVALIIAMRYVRYGMVWVSLAAECLATVDAVYTIQLQPPGAIPG